MRITAKMDIKGLKNFSKMGRQVYNETRDEVQKSALQIESNAKRLAPVSNRAGGGNLRSYINHKITEGGFSAEVTSHADYSAYVEYDTRAHIIWAKKAKALHFKKGGADVFAKWVWHPGTKAQPFMRPAFESEKPHFLRSIEGIVRRATR
jgi:HK97 gp10 family phage protein